MPHFEMNESYYQAAPDGTPDNGRPPQLNTAICGCSGESEGGGSDDEGAAARTRQIFADVPNATPDDTCPGRVRSSEGVDQPSPLPFRGQVGVQRIATRFGGYILGQEGFRPDLFAVGSEEAQLALLVRGGPVRGRVETPASMVNEPHGSDDHSSLSGEVLRRPDIRYGSPGPGMGEWVTAADYYLLKQTEYYFLKQPLRLTPQSQYCRGKVTAHMIVHDEKMDHDRESVFPKRLMI